MGLRVKRGVCAVILSFLLVLSGCGSKNEVFNYEGQPEPAQTLSFFGNKYESENVTVIEDILTAFMLEHPDTRISYESLKGAAYYEALEKRMASGQIDDVFMVNHDTALSFSQAGRLADLSGLEAIGSFSDLMLSQMTEPDGSICWVPTTISAFGLYCNLDLLKAHGREVPANLAEWRETCDYFVARGITPIIANNDISLKTLAIAKGFYALYRDGAQQEAFERINSGEEALSGYLTSGFALAEEFCTLGYIDGEQALATQKTSDDLAQFALGESPFMLTGAWAADRVAALEPDFAFEVTPYPVLEDGAVLVVNPDTRLSVSADSPHAGAALEFVACFLREDHIRKFADNQCSFSPLADAAAPACREISPLSKSYRTETAVIGADSLLDFPVWDLTAEASRRILAGEDLDAVMGWLDEQVREAVG